MTDLGAVSGYPTFIARLAVGAKYRLQFWRLCRSCVPWYNGDTSRAQLIA